MDQPKPRIRDRLAMKLIDAREAFEASGGRYVGGDFSGLNLDRESDRAEAQVLLALLDGYRGHEHALVAFSPRNPESPLFEFASDLLLATPETGCLLIEVKAHRLGGVDFSKEGLIVRYEQIGRSEAQTKSPFRQLDKRVSDFMSNVDQRARRSHQKLRLPIGGVVAFPSISDQEFEAKFFEIPSKPMEHLLFRETLKPENLKVRLLEAGMRAARERHISLPLPAESVDLIDEALYGMPRDLRRNASKSRRARASLGESIDRLRDSNALSPEQREVADRTLEGRPTLLRGVAGSGKSILLAWGLVEMLARRADRDGPENPPARVLVTCFNRLLVPLLRRDIESLAAKRKVDLSLATVEVSHLEKVLTGLRDQWKIEVPRFRRGNEDGGDVRFREVLARVESLAQQHPDLEEELWDHVFVDEAQDLEPEALRLLQRLARVASKSGERGISIYYDDAQNLYGRSRPVWRDLGIHVTGGRTVVLQRGRRTTRPIATLAMNVLVGSYGTGPAAGTRHFADLETLRENDLVIETDDGIVVDFAQRSGRNPEIIVAATAEDEVEEVVTRVRDLVRCEDVRPNEILIQSDCHWKTLRPFREALEGSGFKVRRAFDDRDQFLFEDGVITLSTIHSAKGYDAPIVFIVNAQGFDGDRKSRARFYVGSTRAQLHLVVSGHGSGGVLLLEACEASRRLEGLMRCNQG